MKRNILIRTVLATALVILLAVTVLAAEPQVVASGECGENLTWAYYTDTSLIINGFGEMTSWKSAASVPWEYYRGYIHSIILPEGLQTIGDYAFSGTNIKDIAIPANVTSIGNHAFDTCTGLTSITFPNNLSALGAGAFRNCSLTVVNIPKNVITMGSRPFEGCSHITAFVVAEENPNFSSQDGVLFNKNKTTLLQYPAEKVGSSYTMPNSVTSISDCAFRYCAQLKSINLSCNLSIIPFFAFEYCTALTSIEIPNSVTSIERLAFHGCSSLKKISIPDTVTSIGDEAFSRCALTSIIIPSSVTAIDMNTFQVCTNLTSVTFGNNVTSIGANAFNYCENISDVYFHGTKAQWNNILFKYGNENLLNATIHFLGEPAPAAVIITPAEPPVEISSNKNKAAMTFRWVLSVPENAEAVENLGAYIIPFELWKNENAITKDVKVSKPKIKDGQIITAELSNIPAEAWGVTIYAVPYLNGEIVEEAAISRTVNGG